MGYVLRNASFDEFVIVQTSYVVQFTAPRIQTCAAYYCSEYHRQLEHNGKYLWI